MSLNEVSEFATGMQVRVISQEDREWFNKVGRISQTPANGWCWIDFGKDSPRNRRKRRLDVSLPESHLQIERAAPPPTVCKRGLSLGIEYKGFHLLCTLNIAKKMVARALRRNDSDRAKDILIEKRDLAPECTEDEAFDLLKAEIDKLPDD